jgi:diguanylate cyclase (GGDEF)-like protein
MPVTMRPVSDKRAIAIFAAAIYAGAAAVGLVETALPGGQGFSPIPSAVALVLAAVTALAGARLPRPALMALGPFGALLIAASLSTTSGYGDAAIFYTWPMLWMAYFFGPRGTAFMVAWVALIHALALWAMADAQANFDRWIDVVSAVLVVGLVVQGLATRNARLLTRLEAEARVDPLTGLLNRRGFEERIAPLTTRAGTILTVVVFDLDHFKAINDEHGHEQGDHVLRWVATVLTEQARGADIVARRGGEEFVVLLPRADAAAAHRFAERVRVALDAPAAAARLRHGVPGSLRVTVSAGVASGHVPTSVDDLIATADAALYAAKRAGRDRTHVADAARAAAAADGR